ncbi:ferritin-like domain-containing protein [Endozoicomonas sp. G2_2]|uniref:ferritin-like domain-containing protein n=1 Tax=Endozoicomonas sp. G2_2 TaxID=2821092 RepID=UPI001ADCCE3A|nr:ferritin-like domain-containing protein [Endozoicomonas sp. G2_2]MBO9469783.1 ferritin-like domain-containing protein [Endozoicomonas sp. G2_2]
MADHTKQDEGERRVAIVSGSTGKPISNSRRRFLSNAGMFSAGLVGSTLLAACSDGDSNVAVAQDNNDQGNDDPRDAVSDAAVLQFALNLEYLEAEYYLRAVNNGMGLQDDTISGMDGGMSPGTVIGPRTTSVDFMSEGLIGRYAAEIASDELDHVQFLRTGLQGAGGLIARPAINLRASFDAAATVALQNADAINSDTTALFDPYGSPLAFLIGAFIFEDVGVSAYKGGARFLSNPDFLEAAAGILSVEGYHAGLVRTVLTARAEDGATVTFPLRDSDGNDAGTTDPIPLYTVITAISDARDLVDGDTDLDQGIGDSDSTVDIYGTDVDATNIVPTDDSGITFSRTPAQVHNVVYLNPNAVSQGGFFPEGTRIPAMPSLTTSGGSAPMGGDDTSMDDPDSDTDTMEEASNS